MTKTDFISKKALLKELRKELQECQADAVDYGGENILWAEGIEFAIDTVKKTKSVDVVEVVRCKDCKKHYKDGFCDHFGERTKAKDFCSYGERRSENENT